LQASRLGLELGRCSDWRSGEFRELRRGSGFVLHEWHVQVEWSFPTVCVSCAKALRCTFVASRHAQWGYEASTCGLWSGSKLVPEAALDSFILDPVERGSMVNGKPERLAAALLGADDRRFPSLVHLESRRSTRRQGRGRCELCARESPHARAFSSSRTLLSS